MIPVSLNRRADAEWKTVSIFISSSFNDMHAERDYLVQYVFEELREWCERRRLYLNDIDLRWGVTGEDSDAKNTIKVCLRRIDECRPFFLCFLGQRRGTVFGREGINEETFREYPELSRIADSRSATELEVEHALLAPMLSVINEQKTRPERVKRALFFLREDPFTDCQLSEVHKIIYTNAGADDPAATEEAHRRFKDEVRNSPAKTIDYTCRFDKDKITPELKDYGKDIITGTIAPEKQGAQIGRLCDFKVRSQSLKDVIIDELKSMIIKEYPDRKNEISVSSSPYEIHRLLRARFTRFFIRRDGVFEQLSRYLCSTSLKPLLLVAESGAGKSAMLSNFCREVRDYKVVMRFCGVSADCTRITDVLRGVFDECGISSPIQDEEFFKQINSLFDSLARKGKCLIILDDVTRTCEGVGALKMLPDQIPEGIRLIASVQKSAETESVVRILESSCGFQTAQLPSFTAADKKRLIEDFLNKNLKALDKEQIDCICNIGSTDNPLFLRIILSELRTFGAFSQLNSEIARFGTKPVDAFYHLLERLEEKTDDVFPHKRGAAAFLMGLLCRTRSGLKRSEIKKAMKIRFGEDNDSCSAYIIRCIREYLSGVIYADADTPVDYIYESFKRAAQKRYEDKECEHRNFLASLYMSSDPEECSYQLRMAGSTERLKQLYGDADFVMRLIRSSSGRGFSREVSSIADGVIDPGLSSCARICAQAIAKYPENVPHILYKEVGDPSFRQEIRKMITKPWLRFEPEGGIIDVNTENFEPVPRLENKKSMKISAFPKCFAPKADIAFALSASKEVSVFCMSTVEELYKLKIDCDTPVRLCASGDAKILMTVSIEHKIDIYELVLTDKNFFLKKVLSDNCAKLRFSGPRAFGFTGGVIWQTQDGTIKTYTEHQLKKIGVTQDPLAGAWQFESLILSFKVENGYMLKSDSANVTLPYFVNDTALYGDSLFAAVKDDVLFCLDPSTLKIQREIPLETPVFCIAVSDGVMYGTDEEYDLVCVALDGTVSNLGKINFYDGSVHTNSFEHICAVKGGMFYASDTVLARIVIVRETKGSQIRPKERFFKAVREEERGEIYDTFEGRFKTCQTDSVTYRITDRNNLSAFSHDGKKFGSVKLDKSHSGQYILRTLGDRAVVLTLRAEKRVMFSTVVRCTVMIIDRGNLLFKEEFMPDENIIDAFTDEHSVWLRGGSGFTVIECDNSFKIRNIPFDFRGYSPYSPVVISHGIPVMLGKNGSELVAISGKSGRILALYPLSRALDTLKPGDSDILCVIKERGAGIYHIYAEGFRYDE